MDRPGQFEIQKFKISKKFIVMDRPTKTLAEVLRDLPPATELVSRGKIAIKQGKLTMMEERDLKSLMTAKSWVTNFATVEAEKGFRDMYLAHDKVRHCSISLMDLDRPVPQWLKEFVRALPGVEFASPEERVAVMKESVISQGVLRASHYTYGMVLPNGSVVGRDGKYTTDFLEVIRSRIQLVVRALLGESTDLSAVRSFPHPAHMLSRTPSLVILCPMPLARSVHQVIIRRAHC
jgi:hypothetical protein